MSFGKWITGTVVFLIVLAVGAFYWTSNDLSDQFFPRDLKCNSFGLTGNIVGCDYEATNGRVKTEVVRLQKLVKRGDSVYVAVERNDKQKKVIHENILIGKESDPVTPLAVFYLPFKIPPGGEIQLKGTPMLVTEFEKIFKDKKLAGREAMLDLIIALNKNITTRDRI